MQQDGTQENVSLAEALKGRTGLVSFEPSELSEDTSKKLADLLAAQYLVCLPAIRQEGS